MRILVVEDNPDLASTLSMMLEELGHEVTEHASSVQDGINATLWTLAELAILDVNLDGALSMPVAHQLRRRNIPIVFMTGFSEIGIEQTFKSCPVLIKPFRLEQLSAALNLRFC
jgi:DNA-binding response OmpR family regulator